MDKKVYVCTGTCAAEITEEQYKAGLTKCGVKECDKFGHTFEERFRCQICGMLYKTGEGHSHPPTQGI